MTRLPSRAGIGFVLFACVATLSCSSGPKLYRVNGKVLVKGEPAAGATVMFLPEGQTGMNMTPSTGVCKEDGSFTLTTGTEEGAPPGKYVVTVVWPDPKVKLTDLQKMSGTGPEPQDVLKGKYARGNSQLKAEVKTGENKLEPFQLQ